MTPPGQILSAREVAALGTRFFTTSLQAFSVFPNLADFTVFPLFTAFPAFPVLPAAVFPVWVLGPEAGS